jgi:hypothetical protein
MLLDGYGDAGLIGRESSEEGVETGSQGGLGGCRNGRYEQGKTESEKQAPHGEAFKDVGP